MSSQPPAAPPLPGSPLGRQTAVVELTRALVETKVRLAEALARNDGLARRNALLEGRGRQSDAEHASPLRRWLSARRKRRSGGEGAGEGAEEVGAGEEGGEEGGADLDASPLCLPSAALGAFPPSPPSSGTVSGEELARVRAERDEARARVGEILQSTQVMLGELQRTSVELEMLEAQIGRMSAHEARIGELERELAHTKVALAESQTR